MKTRTLLIVAVAAVLALLAAVWMSSSRTPEAASASPGPLGSACKSNSTGHSSAGMNGTPATRARASQVLKSSVAHIVRRLSDSICQILNAAASFQAAAPGRIGSLFLEYLCQ